LSIILAILALIITYGMGRDFFDSDTLAMSLQMQDLSKAQILMLDACEIIINLTMVIILVFWAIKNNIRKMAISSICILTFIIVEFLIDRFFQNPIV